MSGQRGAVMKHSVLAAFAGAVLAVSSVPALAEVNVALGKPVTTIGAFGTGSAYFGGGPIPPLPAASIVTDGIFQGGDWTDGFWWDEQNSGTHNYVQVDLQGSYDLARVALMVDNNDVYLVEAAAGGSWVQLGTVPEVCCSGLMRRDLVLAAPVTTDALRLSGVYVNAPGHDFAYSVSEIQAYAVPEPAVWQLCLAGLALLAAVAVRRSTAANAGRRPTSA